jgi:hypothetical protein
VRRRRCTSLQRCRDCVSNALDAGGAGQGVGRSPCLKLPPDTLSAAPNRDESRSSPC